MNHYRFSPNLMCFGPGPKTFTSMEVLHATEAISNLGDVATWPILIQQRNGAADMILPVDQLPTDTPKSSAHTSSTVRSSSVSGRPPGVTFLDYSRDCKWITYMPHPHGALCV